MNGARFTLRMALITVGFAAADILVLYLGTQPTWTFVHRWVLMAVGVGSGIGWAAIMMSQSRSHKERLSGGIK